MTLCSSGAGSSHQAALESTRPVAPSAQAEPDQGTASPLQSARLPQGNWLSLPRSRRWRRAQEDQGRNRTKCPDEPEQAEADDGKGRRRPTIRTSGANQTAASRTAGGDFERVSGWFVGRQ